jgi:pyrimidine operon attenuation protein / uracil phosphoribosyltransferase
MQVLDQYQISMKIARLAYEILENNEEEDTIILAGINNKGYRFAELLELSLKSISNKKFLLSRIKLNPAHPLENPIEISRSSAELNNACLIIIDDVANTGRTLFYAFKVCMDNLTKKVEVAVLVDRKHKQFPVKVDYVGLSLATTIQEHIEANLLENGKMTVTLN